MNETLVYVDFPSAYVNGGILGSKLCEEKYKKLKVFYKFQILPCCNITVLNVSQQQKLDKNKQDYELLLPLQHKILKFTL
jgi:hypothetical protein